MKDTFDSVPVSMTAHTKSGAESFQRVLEIVRFTDEKHHIRELLFPAEFAKEQRGELRRSGLKRPHMEELVRVGVGPRRTASDGGR
jgi:hypothetical protein